MLTPRSANGLSLATAVTTPAARTCAAAVPNTCSFAWRSSKSIHCSDKPRKPQCRQEQHVARASVGHDVGQRAIGIRPAVGAVLTPRLQADQRAATHGIERHRPSAFVDQALQHFAVADRMRVARDEYAPRVRNGLVATAALVEPGNVALNRHVARLQVAARDIRGRVLRRWDTSPGHRGLPRSVNSHHGAALHGGKPIRTRPPPAPPRSRSASRASAPGAANDAAAVRRSGTTRRPVRTPASTPRRAGLSSPAPRSSGTARIPASATGRASKRSARSLPRETTTTSAPSIPTARGTPAQASRWCPERATAHPARANGRVLRTPGPAMISPADSAMPTFRSDCRHRVPGCALPPAPAMTPHLARLWYSTTPAASCQKRLVVR